MAMHVVNAVHIFPFSTLCMQHRQIAAQPNY